MTTAKQIIDGAFRELAITQTGEELPSNEAQDALDKLNRLLHAWRLLGVDLNHIDVTLDETMAIEDDHVLPIIFNFAIEVAPEYGKAIRQDLAIKASTGFDNLLSFYGQPSEPTPGVYF